MFEIHLSPPSVKVLSACSSVSLDACELVVADVVPSTQPVKALWARSTASQNARELTVAAVIASTSPPSFLTLSLNVSGFCS